MFWRKNKSSGKSNKYKQLIIGGLLVVLIPLALASLRRPDTAQASWFDDNWAYRKAVNITTHNASENNVYINLTGPDDIDTSDTARFQTDCGDLRFTDAAGKLLQYYIVSGCSSADTVVHVLFSTMPAGAQTVYYYYGNPTVQNGGNAADFATEASSYTFTTIGSEEKTPGPLVYLKFDDGTGTNTQDSTTNNLDGTISGPTWQTEDQCISGKCLWFDGVNDYVYAADNAILDNASSALTVGAWIKPNSYDASNYDIIATKWKDGSPHSYSWHFSLHQGKLSIFISSDGTSAGSELAVDSSVIETNKWSYVVFTVDTATDEVKLYKNGVQVGSTGSYTASSIPNSSAQLRIGTKEGSGEASFTFPGFIDDVKIYPYARSAAQVLADYNSRGSVKGSSTNLGGNTETMKQLNNGLVGYWKMDEASGNATDSSGNGYTGTATGTTIVGGKFGNSRDFAGGTDKLQASNAILSGTGDFTISAWVNRDSASSNDDFAGNYGTGSCTNGVSLAGLTSGKLQLYVGAPVQGSTTLYASTWYHVVGVRSGGSVKLYVNGVEDGSGTLASSIGTNCNWAIGNGPNYTTESHEGLIDEQRIYNRALSPAEVSSLYNFAPGPVGYWNMDENSGISANDTSGNGDTGTLTLGPTWKQGKYGSAVNFDGSDDYIDITGNAVLRPSILTLSAWIKPSASISSGASEKVLIRYVGSSGLDRYGYQLSLSSNAGGNLGKLDFLVGKGTGGSGWNTYSSTKNSWNANQWYYVSVTTDGTNYKFYIDGIAENSSSVSTLYYDSIDSTAQVGGLSISNFTFSGAIDDVRVYNYARSAKQIVSDMNAGHPAVGSPVGSAIGHWKFDEGADNMCSGGTNDTCNSGSQGSTLDGAGSGFASPATDASGWTSSGKFNKALQFDGTNDLVTVSSNTALDAADSYTISTWIRLDQLASTKGAGHVISSKVANSAGNSRTFYTFVSSTNDKLTWIQGNGSGTTTATGTTTISATTWYHVAFVLNNTLDQMSIYVNGRLEGTPTSFTSNPSTNAASLQIGAVSGVTGFTDTFMDGTIDEFKLYSYALTTSELAIDMNRGASQVLGSLSDKSTYEKQAANQEYCVPGDSTSCAAPVGEWKFEENQGVTTFDTSGNASNGTWSGTLGNQWTQGKFGSGGKFDGSSNYVDIGDPSSGVLDFGTGDFTLSAWIKTSTTGVYQDILDKRTAPNGYLMGVLNTNKFGLFAVGGGNNVSVIGDTTVTDGKWHYVAATFDRDGNASVYVDGVSDATPVSMTTVGTVSSTGKAIIGYRDPALSSIWSYFNGQIDQVRAYNYLRTPAQIAWDYNRGAPIGHWKFNECQGTVANDSSGKGNTGTITVGGSGTQTAVGTCTGSADTMWKDGASGKYNSSLDFDGTDDYIQITDSSSLSLGGGSVSMFAWVKGNSISSTQTIIRKENTDYVLATVGSKVWCELSSQSFVTNAGSSMSDGNWYFIGCTFDGTTLRSYLNGVEQGSDNTGTFGADSNGVLSIGRDNDGTQYFNGQIDDPRIYNYALTPLQIKILLNQGAAVRYGPVTGSP